MSIAVATTSRNRPDHNNHNYSPRFPERVWSAQLYRGRMQGNAAESPVRRIRSTKPRSTTRNVQLSAAEGLTTATRIILTGSDRPEYEHTDHPTIALPRESWSVFFPPQCRSESLRSRYSTQLSVRNERDRTLQMMIHHAGWSMNAVESAGIRQLCTRAFHHAPSLQTYFAQ